MGKTKKTPGRAVNGNGDGKEEEKPSKKINRSGSRKVCTVFPFPFMDLPIEIIHRIFFMLPINSIIQCKRVCKSWRNLICQTPDFSVNYIRNTPFKALLLTSANDVTLVELSKNREFVKTPMRTTPQNDGKSSSVYERLCIIGSCHGLTCVLLKTYKTHSERIYLFNLISAQRIPDLVSDHVFDDWKKETVYQFGFVPSANKFKLLRLVFNPRHHLYLDHSAEYTDDCDSLAIFTVGEDDDWRPLPVDSVSIPPSDIAAFITFNGVVHWINNRRRIISTFDLGQEKGGQISHPNMVKNVDTNLFDMKILKDRLSIMEYYWDEPPPDMSDSETMSIADEITIWTMKEYPIEESWTKDYVISINPYSHDVWWHSPFRLVAVLPTGDILFSSISGKGYPVCYNPREKKWKRFHEVYGVSIQEYKIAGVPVPDLNPNLYLED